MNKDGLQEATKSQKGADLRNHTPSELLNSEELNAGIERIANEAPAKIHEADELLQRLYGESSTELEGGSNNEIKFFARHESLPVAAGFKTAKARDDYIALSKANNHPWRTCEREEALNCSTYHNRYEDDITYITYNVDSRQTLEDIKNSIPTKNTPDISNIADEKPLGRIGGIREDR